MLYSLNKFKLWCIGVLSLIVTEKSEAQTLLRD